MAIKRCFNRQWGSKKIDFMFMFYILDRLRATPMFQFAFVAVLFKLRARGPSIKPLLQLPKRRATARGDVDFLPCYYEFFIFLGEFACATPSPPIRLRRQVVVEEGQPRRPRTHSWRCSSSRGRADHQSSQSGKRRNEGRQP